MAKRRIYVDSCVLMEAFKAESDVSDAALEFLEDPTLEHLFSQVTELEVMPKAVFHKHKEEAEFYQVFFDAAVRVPCTEDVIDDALERGKLNGFSACDALHVACAIAGGAEELVTSEKMEKLPSAPLPGIQIRTIR